MINSIIKWLIDIVISIPTEIVKGLIVGFVFLVLSQLGKKVSFIRVHIIKFIQKVRNSNLEISLNTEFIDSPKYTYLGKIKNEQYNMTKSKDTDNTGILIFGLPIVFSVVIQIFIKHVEVISDILKWIGLVPLFVIILFLFVIAISKKVHKITIKFMVYSIFISAFTIYYGINLKNISDGMGYNLIDLQGVVMSTYRILGVFFATIQQIFSYYFLARVICVYIDGKSSRKIMPIKNFIAKTDYLESNIRITLLIIVFSVLSYILTTDWLYNFVIKMNV